MSGRNWLIFANALLWLPLLMAGGSWLFTRSIAAPMFVAALALACLALSLLLLWLAMVQLIRRRVRVADLLWMGGYGIGALLYSQLIGVLSTA